MEAAVCPEYSVSEEVQSEAGRAEDLPVAAADQHPPLPPVHPSPGYLGLRPAISPEDETFLRVNSQAGGLNNTSSDDLQLVFSIEIRDNNSFPDIKLVIDSLQAFLYFYLLLLAQNRLECIQSTAMTSPVTTDSLMTTTLAVWSLNISDL